MKDYILAIDQGTTSSRAMIFTKQGEMVSEHQIAFEQHFPQNGWVEHNPDDILNSVIECCQAALKNASLKADSIAAIGISNQRETTIVWDRATGKPVYNAIVWQDRRTADLCERINAQIDVRKLQAKTGLLLDPYFSATKIAWILDNVEGAREKAESGGLCFGTVDTFLLWHLTKGESHATDASNASRTLLFNIQNLDWDDELLTLFNIPKSLLPEVCDNAHEFGITDASFFGKPIPVTGMAGDQQAATVGQACFSVGMIKSTYGTGCFMMLNTGGEIVFSQNKLLTTVLYRINGQPTYALEGSIFIAGAGVQWLRDGLGLLDHAKDSEELAASVHDTGGVYLVPAFTGLGAPYWDPHARGALLGLTRNSNRAHIVRATLEAVCYQTRDLLEAMINDGTAIPGELRVDGGMVANDWLLEFLSDTLSTRVERASCLETSALGAAYLAGLGAGLYTSLEEVSDLWQSNRTFTPNMTQERREALYQGWRVAVSRVLD